jgi:hypothetical protein
MPFIPALDSRSRFSAGMSVVIPADNRHSHHFAAVSIRPIFRTATLPQISIPLVKKSYYWPFWAATPPTGPSGVRFLKTPLFLPGVWTAVALLDDFVTP